MPASDSRRLVALAEPPGDRFVAALKQAWARGDAVLPIDPSLPPALAAELVTAMAPEIPVDPDVALVIPTSGSTGAPKGAQLTHAALAASARATHERIGQEPDDRWLSCLPWQHIGGLQVMLRARLLDIALDIAPRFSTAVVAASEATLLSLVPTQLLRLLDEGVDLRRFRVILLGGAAAPRVLLDRAADAGAHVVTTYGMSETAGGCVYDGVPLDGVEVAVGEGGRVALRGPMLMSGYRLAPEATAAALVDGWLLTQDRGRIETDGRLTVTGRVDDVIVTGGENVEAATVVESLSRHPAVAEVAVIGVADEQWGQRVVAVAVLRPGSVTPTVETLRDWCRGQLSAAALPRQLVVVPELPRLPAGKVDRLALGRLAAAACAEPSHAAADERGR